MCWGRHVLSKPGVVSRRIKKRVGECHSPTLFCKIKKARQARSGHQGHVLGAARSLEAGSCFPAYKKRAKRAVDTGDMCRGAACSLEAGSCFPAYKKRAKRAVGTGGMCRGRHVLSKPGAVSRRTKKSRLRAIFLSYCILFSLGGLPAPPHSAAWEIAVEAIKHWVTTETEVIEFFFSLDKRFVAVLISEITIA
ncbi:MAG: hypothetical protein FWF77_07475 [Defluviitaleaceae bacterium]|nr:hypothetical protein [Defluviitaleaceae bacterium]